MSITIKFAWLVTMMSLIGAGSITIAGELEKPPVKYVFPFEIVEPEGGYKAGDDLIVQVHFCISPDYDVVYYNTISQSFIPVDGGMPVFTDPIIDLIVDKSNWQGSGIFYTDMEGYECIKSYGAPKKIPEYMPKGCYYMHFTALVDGKSKKHLIEYDSETFCI